MTTTRRFIGLTALTLTLALSGCTQFPELDNGTSLETRRAPYPDLLPVEDLRARVAAPRASEQTTRMLEARVAALRARAARLRGSVIDGTSRARLDRKITIDVPQ
ncbi:hypothetical protein FIU86_04880 [Roseovarius sp. THAF9]|uniref:hypothetical protein n=1 Tax=Roseovarius sp. THAF9 TaxID=2587847 RepID=UPI001268846D|nr:hypothetical protein [Roseovarius sp. THAF9]QFT92164.1 hypothetical protein FIU86_04880 [Roseovarius sp. THAF9]